MYFWDIIQRHLSQLGSGHGTEFGSKVANPSTLPGTTTSHIAFTSDGNFIAYCTSTIESYQWTGSGFGSKKVPTYTRGLSTCNGVTISPDDKYAIYIHNGSGDFRIYRIENDSFTDWVNPPEQLAPGNIANDVAIHPNGGLIFVATSNTLSVYRFLSGVDILHET